MRITIGQVQIEVDDRGIVGDVRIAKPLIDRPGDPVAAPVVAGFEELKHRREWVSRAVTVLRRVRKETSVPDVFELTETWQELRADIARLLQTVDPDWEATLEQQKAETDGPEIRFT